MARKDRVPNPPRRPQSPQRRQTQTDPAVAARRRRNLLLGLGAALVAAALILGATFLSSNSPDERQTLQDAGCTLQTFPDQDGTHLQNLNAKPKWNSAPPTSGPHHPGPAIWGFYDSPVALIRSVHNLEHGGIVIHYGPSVSAETVAQIRELYDRDENGLLVAPLPTLTPKNTIALTAWTAPERTGGTTDNGRGYLAKCTEFDEEAFSAFIDEHRYKGPERFPPDLLGPGS